MLQQSTNDGIIASSALIICRYCPLLLPAEPSTIPPISLYGRFRHPRSWFIDCPCENWCSPCSALNPKKTKTLDCFHNQWPQIEHGARGLFHIIQNNKLNMVARFYAIFTGIFDSQRIYHKESNSHNLNRFHCNHMGPIALKLLTGKGELH